MKPAEPGDAAGPGRRIAATADLVEPGEIRDLAAAGVVTVGLRAIAARTVGLAGTVVFARLLAPDELGAVALALAIVNWAAVLADAGIGAAFVRGTARPTHEQLRAMAGVQLAITSAVAVLAGAVDLVVDTRASQVCAVMALGLPILAFRTPGMTVLERGMRYREIAWIELTESVVFTVCAAALVATGSGVWGLAAAFIVRNVVGTAVLVRLAPTGLVLPAARIAPLRDQLAFGGAFQGWLVLVTMRDQLIAFVAVLSGGIGALGVWWVAARVLQVPMLAADALWRVSCSAMSRLVAAGVDAKPVVERSSRLAVTLFGIVLVPLVAAGPHLVVSVFGQRWEAAGPAVLWVGLGVFIVSPVTVVAGSLLFAAGAGGTLLRIALVDTVFLAVVEALLLPWLGVPGIAIAWIAAAAVSAILLARAVRMRTGARVLRPTVAPAVIAAVISGTGWLTADAVAHSWPLEVAWMGAAEAAYLLVVAASRRGDLTALLGLARSGATRTFGRESPATAT